MTTRQASIRPCLAYAQVTLVQGVVPAKSTVKIYGMGVGRLPQGTEFNYVKLI